MSDNLYFSRDTKMYVAFKKADGTPQAVFEVPILDGFGFSQANNTSEITLAEMESSAGVSRRGRRLFNDSLAPAEWNCSTYVRPFASAGTDYSSGDVHAIENVLWAQMAGADFYNATTHNFETAKFQDSGANQLVSTSDGDDLNITFAHSNRANLQPMDIFFVMETSSTAPVVYKIEDSVVNEATINFEVDGIATIEWSGFGKNIQDITSVAAALSVSDTPPTAAAGNKGLVHLDNDNSLAFSLSSGTAMLSAKDEGIASTSNFIRNRITALTIDPVDATTFPGAVGASGDGEDDGNYHLTLTGGSITITNNIEYLLPEEIGTVNLPLENVTGSRSVTGTLNCYVVYNATNNTGSSTDLFNDMKATAALAKVNNQFALTMDIGGASSGPRLKLSLPTAHLEIPTNTIEDVLSFETNFHGLGSSISSADEISLTYDV